jgi:hypothetical protein
VNGTQREDTAKIFFEKHALCFHERFFHFGLARNAVRVTVSMGLRPHDQDVGPRSVDDPHPCGMRRISSRRASTPRDTAERARTLARSVRAEPKHGFRRLLHRNAHAVEALTYGAMIAH